MKTQLRAISPVIATVIILAVTIAIAIAVVGWISGLFGSFSKGSPTLSIEADSKLYNVSSSNFNGALLILHLRNTGTSDATIYKVEIEGVGKADGLALMSSPPDLSSLDANSISNSEVVLKAGADKYLVAKFANKAVVPGTLYNVKVYVRGVSTPYTTVLTAEKP